MAGRDGKRPANLTGCISDRLGLNRRATEYRTAARRRTYGIASLDNYTMTAFPVDPLPDIEEFSSLLAIWDAKRDGAQLPLKSAFDIEDFGGWLGRIAISEWEDGDCRFRLFGTQFVDLLGRDLTGELLCESLMPDLVEPSKRHFAELRYGSRIGHTTGYVPVPGREFIAFNVLDLPLWDAHSQVGFFLHGLVVGGPVRDMETPDRT